jgi:hypothetical protein
MGSCLVQLVSLYFSQSEGQTIRTRLATSSEHGRCLYISVTMLQKFQVRLWKPLRYSWDATGVAYSNKTLHQYNFDQRSHIVSWHWTRTPEVRCRLLITPEFKRAVWAEIAIINFHSEQSVTSSLLHSSTLCVFPSFPRFLKWLRTKTISYAPSADRISASHF